MFWRKNYQYVETTFLHLSLSRTRKKKTTLDRKGRKGRNPLAISNSPPSVPTDHDSTADEDDVTFDDQIFAKEGDHRPTKDKNHDNEGNRPRKGRSSRTTEPPTCTSCSPVEQPLRGFDSSDDSWQLITSKKPRNEKRAVLYIGNLNSDTTMEKLKRFVASRAKAFDLEQKDVHVFHTPVDEGNGSSSRIFRSADESKTTGARITVKASAVDVMTSRSFWPSPVYARKWNFDLTHSTSVASSKSSEPAAGNSQ